MMERQLQDAAVALAESNFRLGQRIKAARDGRGWKQKQLAAEVSVEPGTVSRWETGRHLPDLTTLQLIAEKTGKPLSFFTEVLDSEGAYETDVARLARIESRLDVLEQSVENALRCLEPPPRGSGRRP
jgi:transcriptional regulator with XRE-family HTH domain